jgi:hypothetical protein
LAGFEAEDELDKLDRRLFEGCQNLEASRVHADLRLFLQDTPGVIFGLEQLLGHQWDPEAAFDLAEAKLGSGDITEGLSRYGVRFEAFPKLEWYKTSARKYVGQPLKDEWLFIWGEQGIGDEIMFTMFLDAMVPRVKNAVIALDQRLIQAFENRHPHWRFVDRLNLPDDLPTFDYACPMGDQS